MPSIVIIGVTNDEKIPFVMVMNTITQGIIACKYVHTG